MARYRQVHTHIWKDDWFLELEPIYKLFFIYLFTNERASISGLYELSKRVMSFESGLGYPEIDEAFEIFGEAQKAFYLDGVVWVKNLRKYHETKSPKVQKAIETDVNLIKDCQVKRIYMEEYGIDTLSIPSNDRVSIPRSSSSSSLVIPSLLITNDFDSAWKRWIAHVEEKERIPTKTQIETILAELAEWGHGAAIEAIDHSIKRGWLSIHRPEKQKNFNGPKGSAADGAANIVLQHIKKTRPGTPIKTDDNTDKAIKLAGGLRVLRDMTEVEVLRTIKSYYSEVTAP